MWGRMEGQGSPTTARMTNWLAAFYSSWVRALLLVVAAVGTIVGAWAFYWSFAESVPIVGLELAGTVESAKVVIQGARAGNESFTNSVVRFRDVLGPDYVLIAGYVVAISSVCFVGSKVFVTRIARNVARFALMSAIGAGLLDVGENLALGIALNHLTERRAGFYLAFAALAASAKFSLLFFAIPIASGTAVAVMKRALAASWTCPVPPDQRGKIWLPSPISRPPHRWPGRSSAVVAADKWNDKSSLSARARHRYSRMLPKEREAAAVGFCVSGGGIRSACVTLGALQSLRQRLRTARYLISVSGGGYAAGAMQLALQGDPGEGASLTTPRDVYCPGSPEEDHTRRHGKYVADGAGEWIAAVTILLRGVLTSVTLGAAAICLVGLLFSLFYREIPLAPIGDLLGNFVDDVLPEPPGFPAPEGNVGTVVLWLTGAGAVLWLFSVIAIDAKGWGSTRRNFLMATRALMALALLVSTVLYVLPAIAWSSAYVTWLARNEGSGAQWAFGGVAGSLLATYVGALVSIIWKHRERVGGWVKRLSGALGRGDDQSTSVRRVIPQSLVQRIIVVVVLLLLFSIGLLLLGIAMITATKWDVRVQWGIPIGVFLAYRFVDQTWMSLHPFYRRRLATAFSVRRSTLSDGDVAAHPYDFEKEATPLATYGMRPHEDFPQVIFSCAANLSGSDRTPPGRRAVSYTMSHDYIGGPDVGYVPTDVVMKIASGPLSADLTVQAAIAISGAAFASAMGSQSRPIQTLLALANARLGTWLPNPSYLDEILREERPWWAPSLPRLRRLTYLLREILGYFPADDRLLLVTDGGHYDNLGLVELLRHRCRRIYCIDASGDSPPFPVTLLQAMTVAQEELGITIRLNDARKLLPGTATALPPPLEKFSERLSEAAVITGVISYPEGFDAEGDDASTDKSKGLLVFAKAVLTPDVPDEVLGYAESKPGFPRDSTGDQWFTHDQFNAYQLLGQYIGDEAARIA